MMYNDTKQNKLNRYGKKGIMLFIPLFLLLFGSLLFCFAGWKWIGSTAISKVLVQSEKVEDIDIKNPLEVEVDKHKVKIPQLGEEIGTINIPALNKQLPMFYGWQDSALSKGVGLDNRWIGSPKQLGDSYDYTLSLPGDGGHVVVAGHRDTVFSELGNLKQGDEVVLNLPYGTFTYEMDDFKIVDQRDTSILVQTDKEILTVYTCYPFYFIGNAPNRYIVNAHLKSAVFKDNIK